MNNTEPTILKRVEDLGYAVFRAGIYNLNIIGVRSPSRESGKFDDSLHCVYKDEYGNWIDLQFQITTDAGLAYMHDPMKITGTAILKAGQYRSAYKLGKHRGQYDALVQIGKVTICRDANKDDILDHDPATLTEGYFGINIHRASSSVESINVGKWSAGCQVFSDPNEFAMFIALCKKSASIWGETFTYTLIED